MKSIIERYRCSFLAFIYYPGVHLVHWFAQYLSLGVTQYGGMKRFLTATACSFVTSPAQSSNLNKAHYIRHTLLVDLNSMSSSDELAALAGQQRARFSTNRIRDSFRR